MRRWICMALWALPLAAGLCACASEAPPAASPVVPQAAQTESANPAETPALSTGYDFQVLPVTEEGIRTLYGWEGYEVRKITPYLDDFLVEYGYSADRTFSLLSWVFGKTGRRVQLIGTADLTSYEINGVGEVTYTATGVSAVTPWKGMPETGTVRVLGDAN